MIFSTSWDEHRVHVKEVLGRLKGAVLTANPAKCTWGGKTMEFLGHLVGMATCPYQSRGLRPWPTSPSPQLNMVYGRFWGR